MLGKQGKSITKKAPIFRLSAYMRNSFINFLINSLPQQGQERGQEQAETQMQNPISSQSQRPAPTTKPTAYTVLSTISDRLLLRLIDTPGLELPPGEDWVAAKKGESERSVKGLLSIVEERFEYTLREERKVRRRVGAEEGLVHLGKQDVLRRGGKGAEEGLMKK